MERAWKVLTANAAWLITTFWLGLIVLNALSVARGDPDVAGALLAGPNLLVAAVTAAQSLVFFVVGLGSPLCFLISAGLVKPTPRRTVTRILFIVLGLFGWFLLLATSTLLDFAFSVVMFVAWLNLLLVYSRGRKWIAPAYSEAGRIPGLRSVAAFSLALGIAFVVVSGNHWVQEESVRVSGAATEIRYFVSQDGEWSTFLNYRDRTLELFRNEDIEARQYCRIEARSQLFDWLSLSAHELLGAPRQGLPICPRPK